MFDVIGIGNLNYDIVMPIDRFPKHHEKLSVEAAFTGLGGSAGNTISWLASLGLKTGFIGAVGKDEFGKTHLNYFSKKGVDISHIKRVDKNTGIAVVMEKDGDKRMLKSPAANKEKKIDLKYLSKAKHIHLSSNPREILKKVTKFAHEKDMTVSLDKGGGELPTEIENKIDYLIMNEDEFKREFGSLNLKKSKAKNVIITLNKGGAKVKEGEKTYKIEGFGSEVVDTTGAGDAFDAGLIYGCLNDWKLKKSVRFGNFLADLTIQRIGARTTIVPLKKIKQRLQEINKILL